MAVTTAMAKKLTEVPIATMLRYLFLGVGWSQIIWTQDKRTKQMHVAKKATIKKTPKKRGTQAACARIIYVLGNIIIIID
jgi:hypothetical protein